MPKDLSKLTYCEPFIGGGALFFYLQPQKAIINDYNNELINVYRIIKEDIEDLIEDLKKHKNDIDYFYELRKLDRMPLFNQLTNVEKASRVIYLNKTCYNGLYRVNNAGEFNSPFGYYKNPNIVNEPVLRAVSRYLNSAHINIFSLDYETVLQDIPKKSFVYLDPPYHPLSPTSNFTGYIQGGWKEEEQIRLKKVCDELTARGIKFLQSNSSANFIRELYSDYKINIIEASRSINSDAEKRGAVNEFLIRNYE